MPFTEEHSVQSAFGSEFRPLDLNTFDVKASHPGDIFAIESLKEVVERLARRSDADVHLTDNQVTLLVQAAQYYCHVIHHFNLGGRMLAVTFNLDTDTSMTVLMKAGLFGEGESAQEEWFFSTYGLILPSEDPEEWSSDAEDLDEEHEGPSRQRAARIYEFIAVTLAMGWISESPITPLLPPTGMP